ncbi:MAG TPA: hypothetical protein PLV92_03040, partial [Pirellulaceae bacterium]|nr:hypothetical protein [Pirellulaceae bacterium]
MRSARKPESTAALFGVWRLPRRTSTAPPINVSELSGARVALDDERIRQQQHVVLQSRIDHARLARRLDPRHRISIADAHLLAGAGAADRHLRESIGERREVARRQVERAGRGGWIDVASAARLRRSAQAVDSRRRCALHHEFARAANRIRAAEEVGVVDIEHDVVGI